MEQQNIAKGADEIYCPSCGAIIKKEAVICVKCGVPLHGNSMVGQTQSKDKTVAVLLAVFLGFWTWLYTYNKDSWKFWLNLALTIVTFGIYGFAAWIWAIIDVASKPDEHYRNYPNG